MKSRVLHDTSVEGDSIMCEWVTSTGQCTRPAMPDSRFCEQHNPKSEQLRLNQYLLNKKLLGDSPTRHAAADEVKSLKTEIALLRALVERRLNMIETDAELANALPQLKDTFLAVEKLVTSCHSMETKLGELLGKGALISLAQKMVHVIDLNLEGIPNRDEIVEKIGNEIATAITEQAN